VDVGYHSTIEHRVGVFFILLTNILSIEYLTLNHRGSLNLAYILEMNRESKIPQTAEIETMNGLPR
jgi:hypothetical protein